MERSGGKRLLYTQTGDLVTKRSVGGGAYGRFLIDIFEEWVRRDVGKVFVQMFDVTLEAYFGRHLLCIHAPVCGYGPALEHNGDVYTCDHFVEPGQKLGNIPETPLVELVASPQMRKFGADKRDTLTGQCRACEVRFLCNGGCPKDRFVPSKDGEPGHNYLCAGLERFFTHTRPLMGVMGQLLKRGRPPADVMLWVKNEDSSATLIRPVLAAAARSSSSATATRRRRRFWRDGCAALWARRRDQRWATVAPSPLGHDVRVRLRLGPFALHRKLAAATMSRSRKKLRNVRIKAIAREPADVVPARRPREMMMSLASWNVRPAISQRA